MALSKIAMDEDLNFKTDETAVGTWIDGKTLYRKVFTGTITSENVQQIIGTISGSINVVRFDGVVGRSNGERYSDGRFISFRYEPNGNISVNQAITSNAPAVVIVYYTKN